MKNLKDLEKKLQISFRQPELLQQALVHRSYLNESAGRSVYSNERLEFLGDAVLSLSISSWLYERFPEYPEGLLTNLRSNTVRTTSLAKIAKKLSIGEYLLMSKGETESGGAENQSILANTIEAIIGAIYLDQGIICVNKFIKQVFAFLVDEAAANGQLKDAKSLLQEKLQSEIKITPIYKTLSEEGPDHQKTFIIGVFAGKKLLAKGLGKSKQAAEEKAAQKALKKSLAC